MGLEAVEILIDVEEHFGISVHHTDAEPVRTVGDLVALIQSQLQAAPSGTCPTLKLFSRLRSTVRDIANDDTLSIRTDTRIIDALSPAQRRMLWARLNAFEGSTLPPLLRPATLRLVVALITIAILGIAVSVSVTIDAKTLPLSLAIAAMLVLALHRFTLRYQAYPPDPLTTFGDLTQRIAGKSVATQQAHLCTTEQILEELRPIVAKTLGVDEAEVNADARLVEDLGMR